MRFVYRGEPVDVRRLESVVAIRPPAGVPAAKARANVPGHFGRALPADDGTAPISATARRLFASAGYLFAQAPAALTENARTARRRGYAAHPVYIDPARNALVGTRVVTVQVPEDLTPAQARQQMKADGLTVVERLPFGHNLYSARLPGAVPLDDAVDALQDGGRYVWVEPAFLQVLRGRQGTPDPDLHAQWHHENDGSTGIKGCDARTRAAWRSTRGKDIRIAVVDNGMQVDHPDLRDGVVFAGQFEQDEGGRVRVSTPAMGPFPDDAHGTFCLGMAGARRNNGAGGCGAAPEAELLALACARDQVGTQLTLARAIAFAANPSGISPGAAPRGADVLSCSLGAENGAWRMDRALDTALRDAAASGRGGRGMPIFWAVANTPTPLEQDEVCSHPDVIAVGTSGPGDIRRVCAYGPRLAFLAPGVDVFSTSSGGRYDTDTGSSYACALASGVAALLLAKFPHWSRDQVRARLESTCDPVGGLTIEYGPDGRNAEYGHGRINADRALNDPLS